jgi:hypothetical protein
MQDEGNEKVSLFDLRTPRPCRCSSPPCPEAQASGTQLPHGLYEYRSGVKTNRSSLSGRGLLDEGLLVDFARDMAESPSVPYASCLLSVNDMRTDPTRNASTRKEELS